MGQSDRQRDEQGVRRFIREMNDAWTRDSGERLSEYFHPRMSAITPSDRLRCEGAYACIQGWRDFAARYPIRAWRQNDMDIELFGDTAIVTCYFDMAIIADGDCVSLQGRDMMTLYREGGLIADQFSAVP